MSDLIDREQALEKLRERHKSAIHWHEDAKERKDEEIMIRAESSIASFAECILTLKDMPSAEPKKAVWIGEYDGYADGNVVIDNWYCSNCDYCYEDFEKPDWNYCPNCGAKMEVREGNEEHAR